MNDDRRERKLPPVEMVVRDAGGCPVLRCGGRMVYVHPEIAVDGDGRICARSVSALIPAAEKLAEDASGGKGASETEFTCPVEGCGAVFGLRVLPDDEAARASSPAAACEKIGGGPREAVFPRRARGPTSATRAGPAGPFLSRLPPEIIGDIVDASTIRRYDQPTVVIREGEESHGLYVVAEGEVEIIGEQMGVEGKVVWTRLGKGECVGETSALTDLPATATARTAGEETILLVIPRDRLKQLLATRPALNMELCRVVAARLYNAFYAPPVPRPAAAPKETAKAKAEEARNPLAAAKAPEKRPARTRKPVAAAKAPEPMKARMATAASKAARTKAAKRTRPAAAAKPSKPKQVKAHAPAAAPQKKTATKIKPAVAAKPSKPRQVKAHAPAAAAKAAKPKTAKKKGAKPNAASVPKRRPKVPGK